jgi:hypothetical protein
LALRAGSATASNRRLHLVSFDVPFNAPVRGSVDATTSGRPPRVVALRSAPIFRPADSVRVMRDLLLQGGQLSLPASRLWELIPTFRPARLERGDSWIDTLSFAIEDFAFRQALSGIRVSTLLGDTTVAGRRLWIVSDSAVIRYEERSGRLGSGQVEVTRTAAGVGRGRALYDPALGLFRTRSDSALLAGTVVSRHPDGRVIETPARFERRRRWVLHDALTYQAWERQQSPAVLAATRVDQTHLRPSRGVLVDPPIYLDWRMALGDVSFLDSLVDAFERSVDPAARNAILERSLFWQHDSVLVRRVHASRVAHGDSAYLLQQLARRLHAAARLPSYKIDERTMRDVIALLQRGSRFIDSERLVEALETPLVSSPPAIARDTSQWPCTPAACALLAEQWRTAREPKLKRLGLVAHFVRDPRRWTDTLLADTTPSEVEWARLLARGVGATSPDASRDTLPPPGAGWHAWLEWLVGISPTAPQHDFSYESLMRMRGLEFHPPHATAIRFTQVRTGRDIVGELRQMLAQASADSAKLVLEYILTQLGDFTPTVSSVAAHVRSGSAQRIELGAHQAPMLFRGSPPRADSATAARLTDELIALTLGENRPWRVLNPRIKWDVVPNPPIADWGTAPTYILADSTPVSLRPKWSGRLITGTEWAMHSPQVAARLVAPGHVSRTGPFARISIETVDVRVEVFDRMPMRYRKSTTYDLMEQDGAWRILGIVEDAGNEGR